jgi:outer membrane protein OmpA-like peptidoglycan-associated protein/tetratricopeptide (TPR) repeat protein
MMKKLLFTIIGLSLGTMLLGQNSYFKNRANREFKRMNYSEAITYYEHLYKAGGADINDLKNMATAYQKVNDSKDAERILKLVIEKNPFEPMFVKNLALALESNAKYSDAAIYWKHYLDMSPDDKVAQYHLEFLQALPRAVQDSAFVDVYDLSINSHWSEFSPTLYDNDIVFISNRATGPVHYVFEWNHTPFLDIYYADTSRFKKRIYKRLLLQDGDNDGHISYQGKLEQLHDDHTPITSNDNDTKGYYGHHPIADSLWENDTVYGEVTNKFNKHLHTKYHEASLTFSKDLQKMYFTANNPRSRKSDGIIKLMIVEAVLHKNEIYKHDMMLPFSSSEYSVCHPTLTDDDSTMYFASDMPGGYGGMDIYKVTKTENTWGTPQNLGPKINTQSNELFPFIYKNDILYFASQGWGGFGGLDMFTFNLKKDSKPTNLGFPINSNRDDFGLIMKNDKAGYLSSNRKHGYIDDDIYYFFDKRRENKKLIVKAMLKKTDGTLVPLDSVEITINELVTNKQVAKDTSSGGVPTEIVLPTHHKYLVNGLHKDAAAIRDTVDFEKDLVYDDTLEMVFIQDDGFLTVTGIVKDNETKMPIPRAKVFVYNTKKKTIQVLISDQNGAYAYQANFKTKYLVKAMKEGYFADCQQVDVKKQINNAATQPLVMSKIKVNKIFEIKDLYYDFNKENIRNDASLVLDRLIHFLKEYPEIHIELGSHTDARGSDNFNLGLSQRRAASAVTYVVKNGIDAARIRGKGYGEKKLLNRCNNIVKCSETEHQLNRRTEIKVTQVEYDKRVAAKSQADAEKDFLDNLLDFDPCNYVKIGK